MNGQRKVGLFPLRAEFSINRYDVLEQRGGGQISTDANVDQAPPLGFQVEFSYRWPLEVGRSTQGHPLGADNPPSLQTSLCPCPWRVIVVYS